MIIQFTPVANSSEEYAQVTIPMAVISHDDWIKYKDKVGQYVHSSLQQEFKNLQCCGCGQAFSIPFKFIFTIKTTGLSLFSQDLTLILLPNCYLFPCMLVTRIWVYMKGKTSSA